MRKRFLRGREIIYTTVRKTKKLSLCLSCSICKEVCRSKAIGMVYCRGIFVPKINLKKCTRCGLCLKLCPGIDIDPHNFSEKLIQKEKIYQKNIECYEAYCRDEAIRANSTSGGMVTGLIAKLIGRQVYEEAFVVKFSTFEGRPVSMVRVSKFNDIISAAGSKYIPVAIDTVIKSLREFPSKRYIIAGTACQIYGIKKFIIHEKINDKNLLFLGLFCEKTLNFNVIKYIRAKSSCRGTLVDFQFRSKQEKGWPGDVKMTFDSGRVFFVGREIRMRVKKFFQLRRCLFCLDKLNSGSDISFGDCYIPERESFLGKSNLIIWTKKGRDALNSCADFFKLKRENFSSIAASQQVNKKLINAYYVNELKSGKKNAFSRSLRILDYFTQCGGSCSFFRIGLYFALCRIRVKVKRFLRKIILFLQDDLFVPLEALFGFYFYRRAKVEYNDEGSRILICGSEMQNKGSQAMTFAVIDRIKKKYPKSKITILSFIYSSFKEKEIYRFKILPYDEKIVRRFLPISSKIFGWDKERQVLTKEVQLALRSADLCLDVSGYSLGTSWGKKINTRYLLHIYLAKIHRIPFFILPQSMGSLNYKLRYNLFRYPLMKACLRYPKRIMLREKNAVKSVEIFTKKKVDKVYDIVLQANILELQNIYKKYSKNKKVIIDNSAVGIIPNFQVKSRISSANFYEFYQNAITFLLNAGKNIYLLMYSGQDKHLCAQIKQLFDLEDRVVFLADDFDAFELENIVSHFEVVVASRYHSIIHSYKNSVPVLGIGWEDKYIELFEEFKQSEYLIDIRDGLDIAKTINVLKGLIAQWPEEKSIINYHFQRIRKSPSFFDIFSL